MNKKHRRFIALYLAGIGAVGAFASVSAASIATGMTTQTRDQIHTAIKEAFQVGDYQAFLAATKKEGGDEPIITEAQFNAMIQAQKLRAAGDIAGAKKILADAGIKPPVHGKTGKGHNLSDHGMMHGNRGEMRALVASLTDAQKTTLKQARTLMRQGKKDEADTLLKNAGIVLPLHGNRSATTTAQ